MKVYKNYNISSILSNKISKNLINNLEGLKNIIIFDIGCYKGEFSKNIINCVGNQNIKNIYLFDVNKNSKKYVFENLNSYKDKLIYNEVAIHDEANDNVNFYFNSFYEEGGSSLDKTVKNDKLWNFSRRFLLNKNLSVKTKKLYKIIKVKTNTLDNFIKTQKLKKINLLKIDTECNEIRVLKGSKNTLNNKIIDNIYIEIMDNKKSYKGKKEEIINYLKKYDYELIDCKKIKSLTMFSNLFAEDCYFKKINI